MASFTEMLPPASKVLDHVPGRVTGLDSPNALFAGPLKFIVMYESYCNVGNIPEASSTGF